MHLQFIPDAFGGQGGVDGGHDLQAHVMLFEQMTKAQNGALNWQEHAAGVKAGKLAVQRDIESPRGLN